MAYSNGTYTNVSGATTAVAGNILQSTTWNSIHTDIGDALTQVMQQLISSITYRNALFMNGGMEVWQRGAASSAVIAVAASNTLYTADRWYLSTGANQDCTVSAVTGLSNGSQSAAAIQRTAGQTGTTAMVFAYPLDTDEILKLRGNKVSFSCLVKTGANWSPTNGTLTAILYVGTGAVAKRNVTPYTGETTVFSIATNLIAGGAITTISGSSSAILPVTSTQAEIQFTWTPVGAAGAVDTVQIDDVQIESQLSTSTWTPTNYDRLPFSFQRYLCQRHYAKTFNLATAVAQSAGLAGALSIISQAATRAGIWWQFPVVLRSNTPSITTYNPISANANWRNVTSGADSVVTVDPNTAIGNGGIQVITATVTAVDQSLYIHVTVSAGI